MALCLSQIFRDFRQIQPNPQAHPNAEKVSVLPTRRVMDQSFGIFDCQDYQEISPYGDKTEFCPLKWKSERQAILIYGQCGNREWEPHLGFLNWLFHLCSYYPLYPPHEDMAIDYENFYTYAQLPVTPDVFIVPSELRYFVKVGFVFQKHRNLTFPFRLPGTCSNWVYRKGPAQR